MTDSPEPEAVIPLGLRKRWEAFGDLSRKCWIKVKAKALPVGEQFETFLECMRVGDPVTQAQIDECARLGHPLAPAPICVLAKTAKDMSGAEAVRQCLAEGKVHGISRLACEAAKAGQL